MTGWVMATLWGGFVGLDATSFPQAMISRPLVSASVTGALLGRPLDGLVIGFILEAFTLLVLPIGAVRYPESGTAGVAATAAVVAVGPPGLDPGTVALAVTFALGWEWVGGETVVWLRRQNGRMLVRVEGRSAGDLERRHLGAMGLDFLRGLMVTVVGGVLAAGLLALAAPAWGPDPGTTWAVLAVVTAAMTGTAVPLHGGIRARHRVLAAGLVVGVALGLLVP
ncbi:MAG: PTS sugar transporter subunit IIC [Gemmatimonadota bacterium]